MRNLLIIALGGHGRKLAVLLEEQISQFFETTQSDRKFILKTLSIDFAPIQDSGYLVNPSQYFAITHTGQSIDECWNKFQMSRNLGNSPEEFWVQEGPISDDIRRLNGDSAHFGLRHVDYHLLIHQSKERMSAKIRETLVESLSHKSESNEGVTVIILGSVAGWTSSICYLALLKILDSLSHEIKLEPGYSFLFTPNAFHQAYFKNNLNIFCFLESTNAIHQYFKEYRDAFKPAQYLLNRLDLCLQGYRENSNEILECNTVKDILDFINSSHATNSRSEILTNAALRFDAIKLNEIQSMIDYALSLMKNNTINDYYIPGDMDKIPYKELFENLV